MDKKAITLYQPWASLLACGAKIYETQSWQTEYRGEIFIHSSKVRDKWWGFIQDDNVAAAAANALMPHYGNDIDIKYYNIIRLTYPHLPVDTVNFMCLMSVVPHGSIIAKAVLVDCFQINFLYENDGIREKHAIVDCSFDVKGDELVFGDWTAGRYAWEFANMDLLPEPIPAKGEPRIWTF